MTRELRTRLFVVLAVAGILGAAPSRGCAPTVTFSELAPAKTDMEKRDVRASAKVMVGEKESDIGYTTILRSGQTRGWRHDPRVRPAAGRFRAAAVARGRIAADRELQRLQLAAAGRQQAVLGGAVREPAGRDVPDRARARRTTARCLRPAPSRSTLRSIHGMWNPCAGMVTPWNTHLGSEEYEPDRQERREQRVADGAVLRWRHDARRRPVQGQSVLLRLPGRGRGQEHARRRAASPNTTAWAAWRTSCRT